MAASIRYFYERSPAAISKADEKWERSMSSHYAVAFDRLFHFLLANERERNCNLLEPTDLPDISHL